MRPTQASSMHPREGTGLKHFNNHLERNFKEQLVSLDIAYTKQRENHGTMILQRVSFFAYTYRYGSYCTYGIVPSSQSSLTFFWSFTPRVP